MVKRKVYYKISDFEKFRKSKEPTWVEFRVTAPLARHYLAVSKECKQRDQRPGSIKELAKEIREGRFRLTAAGVVIVTDDGNVRNGQHRMEAILEVSHDQPDIAVNIWFHFGEPTENHPLIDRNKARTAVDEVVTQEMGFNAPKFSKDMYAAFRLIYGICYNVQMSGAFTASKYKELYPSLRTSADRVIELLVKAKPKMRTGPVYAALILAWYLLPKVKMHPLIQGLAGEANLGAGSPGFVIRDAILDRDAKDKRNNTCGERFLFTRKILSAVYCHINDLPMSRVADSPDTVRWFVTEMNRKTKSSFPVEGIARIAGPRATKKPPRKDRGPLVFGDGSSYDINTPDEPTKTVINALQKLADDEACSVPDLAAAVDLSQEEIQRILNDLLEKKLVNTCSLGTKRHSQVGYFLTVPRTMPTNLNGAAAHG